MLNNASTFYIRSLHCSVNAVAVRCCYSRPHHKHHRQAVTVATTVAVGAVATTIHGAGLPR
jgi:hypothetical protein